MNKRTNRNVFQTVKTNHSNAKQHKANESESSKYSESEDEFDLQKAMEQKKKVEQINTRDIKAQRNRNTV